MKNLSHLYDYSNQYFNESIEPDNASTNSLPQPSSFLPETLLRTGIDSL